MRSTGNSRRARSQHEAPAERDAKSTQEDSSRSGLFARTGAWLAGVAAVVVATTLAAWLTNWGKSFTANSTSGPAFYVITDIDPGSEYVLASPVTSAADKVTLLSGTSSDADIMALIARHGGVRVHQLTVTVILTGNRSSLRIVDIKPNAVPAKVTPTAAYLRFASAGEVGVTSVSANLDSPVPVLDEGSSPYFDSHEIDLVRGERYSFRMTFETGTAYREFNLSATYVYGGKQYEQTIPGPAHGLFQVTGLATDYHVYGAIYLGFGPDQFEVANRSQSCSQFPRSKGC